MKALPWTRLERRAARLEDLAVCLDAGMDPSDALRSLGAGARDVRSGVAAAVTDALALGEVDHRALDAAEHAGELPAALREQAATDHAHASIARDIAARVAYPVFLVVFAIAVVAWLRMLGFAGTPPWMVALWAALLGGGAALVAWAVRRARRDPGFDIARIPILGAPLAHAADARYLTAMRRLHGAGIRIDEAHALATRASPLAHARARLTAASSSLAAHASYGDALRAARAFDEDALRSLESAERAGALEDAFARLSRARTAQVEIEGRRAARLVGAVVYTLAVAAVIAVVFGFYGAWYGRIG